MGLNLFGERVYDVTRQRLRRMLKYFTGKKIHCRYEYNNSLGMHEVREHTGTIARFEIVMQDVYHSWQEFTMKIYFTDGSMMEETVSSEAEFYGLGQIRECNSGPYNYFSITRK